MFLGGVRHESHRVGNESGTGTHPLRTVWKVWWEGVFGKDVESSDLHYEDDEGPGWGSYRE